MVELAHQDNLGVELRPVVQVGQISDLEGDAIDFKYRHIHMSYNMFMRKPKEEQKPKQPSSCQHERKKAPDKKKKPLEKITMINNVRIV